MFTRFGETLPPGLNKKLRACAKEYGISSHVHQMGKGTAYLFILGRPRDIHIRIFKQDLTWIGIVIAPDLFGQGMDEVARIEE